ncbi:MAG: hypothetical protein LBG11_04700 [Bifidobacteriaceae bacterium]|nr:hypothetical protein [Bifidobacteriaceae bacterium]
MGEQAKSAMDRTYDLVNDALACCRSRTPEENKELASAIRKPLIKKATYHGATLGPDAAKEGPDAAKELGLPVADADLDGQEWKTIWALWTRYFSVGVWPEGRLGVYEGELASQIIEYAS